MRYGSLEFLIDDEGLFGSVQVCIRAGGKVFVGSIIGMHMCDTPTPISDYTQEVVDGIVLLSSSGTKTLIIADDITSIDWESPEEKSGDA